jgi:hypothetical protein
MMTNLEALFAGERHHYLPITYRWILVAFLSAGAIRWHDQFEATEIYWLWSSASFRPCFCCQSADWIVVGR